MEYKNQRNFPSYALTITVELHNTYKLLPSQCGNIRLQRLQGSHLASQHNYKRTLDNDFP